MDNKIWLKVGTGILALAMIFSLSACVGFGEVENYIKPKDEETETVAELDNNVYQPSNASFIGRWQSDFADDDSYHEAIITKDGMITVYTVTREARTVYWVGTCITSLSDEDISASYKYVFTSTRDDMAEMEHEKQTLDFTYRDGNLYYFYIDKHNDRIWISLSHVSDSTEVIEQYEYSNPNAEEEPTEETENIDSSETLADSDENNNILDEPTFTEQINEDTDSIDNEQQIILQVDDFSSVDTQSDNSIISIDDNVSVCNHTYDSGTVTVKATCEKSGVRTYTCIKCGVTRTEIIPATGHDYEQKITKKATCNSKGTCVYECTICGDSYSDSIPATGEHNYQPVYKTVHYDATGHYESEKKGVYKCNYSGCGKTFNTAEEVLNHIDSAHDGRASYSAVSADNKVWVEDVPAHDEKVVDYYKCSVCNEIKK